MQQLLRVSLAIDRLEQPDRHIAFLAGTDHGSDWYLQCSNPKTESVHRRRPSSNMYIEAQWYMFSLVFLWAGAYALRNGAHVR